MEDIETYRLRLLTAELQFRLAVNVRLAVSKKEQPLNFVKEWSYWDHKVDHSVLALRDDQADFAAWSLRQSSTLLLTVEIRNAIKYKIKNPKESSDYNILSAYQISRLIRNSFTHSPFQPIWHIDDDCKNKVFQVKDIISLDTKNLDQRVFKTEHYGGPLSLLYFCRYIRACPEISLFLSKIDIVYFNTTPMR